MGRVTIRTFTRLMADAQLNSKSAARSITTRSWGRRRRLEFIDFRLFWEGRINRGELVRFFGTSVQQSSLDLAHYLKAAPQNIRYDAHAKTYRATRRFTPIFARIDSSAYLDELLANEGASRPQSLSFVGWRPPFETVRYPARAIRPAVLAMVGRAIRDSAELDVTYVSLKEASSSRRRITPHAIAFDGTRWHARAWCHQNADFRDFVIARIEQVHGSKPSSIDAESDRQWNTFATVVLRPRDQLTPRQRAIVESEFGMDDGALRVQIREALVFYYLRHLQLDQQGPASRQPIELANRGELERLLDGFDEGTGR
jgi:WYL domain